MVSTCPKCGKTVPDESVYCLYCGYGIKPWAKTTQVSVGSALIIVASVTSLIIFIISLTALTQIYNWYPADVARDWIAYDQAFAVFSFTGFVFGLPAAALSLARRSYGWMMLLAILCTLSGASVWIISMIVPLANVWYSTLYYFLPMFFSALIGTVLVYPRRAEFRG